MGFYKPETYPKNIKYLLDNNTNAELLEQKFGKPEDYSTPFKGQAYIKFNTDDNTWSYSPTFEWLYRDTPPLTAFNDLTN